MDRLVLGILLVLVLVLLLPLVDYRPYVPTHVVRSTYPITFSTPSGGHELTTYYCLVGSGNDSLRVSIQYGDGVISIIGQASGVVRINYVVGGRVAASNTTWLPPSLPPLCTWLVIAQFNGSTWVGASGNGFPRWLLVLPSTAQLGGVNAAVTGGAYVTVSLWVWGGSRWVGVVPRVSTGGGGNIWVGTFGNNLVAGGGWPLVGWGPYYPWYRPGSTIAPLSLGAPGLTRGFHS